MQYINIRVEISLRKGAVLFVMSVVIIYVSGSVLLTHEMFYEKKFILGGKDNPQSKVFPCDISNASSAIVLNFVGFV